MISKLQRIKKHPDQKLEKWVAKHSDTMFYLSVLTIGEIQSGISKLNDKTRKMHLEEWIFGELIPHFEKKIIPIGNKVILNWGKMIGTTKQRGINIPVIDSLIGATALTYNLILVTENIKDFQNMNVETFSPWV